LFAVKDNQKSLCQNIQELFELDDFPPQHTTIDKQNGLLEEQKIWTSPVFNDYLDFPYMKQVFCIERTREILTTNKRTTEVVYGITSLSEEKACPEKLLQLAGGTGQLRRAMVPM